MSVDAVPFLQTSHLTKQFDGLIAVEDVSLTVREGTFHSIIGPNGAGKTTLFNLLSGAFRPTGGTIHFRGRDITRLLAFRRSHLGIGRSFQITNIFPTLTTLENVRLAAQSRGSDSFKIWANAASFDKYVERASEVLDLVGLRGKEKLSAQTLPHGDKRKLEIAIMLATDPDLLLLDEPTAGISQEEVPVIMDVIRRIKTTTGRTIMLVEHKMEIIMNMSDVISVMHQGHLIATGSPAEISRNETVQSAYLGSMHMG